MAWTGTRRGFSAGGLSLLSAPLAGCQLLGLEWHYRYRIEAEVTHGGQMYRGSSVIEIMRQRGFDGIGGTIRGQAACVDIPAAGTLFLILRGGDESQDWPMSMPHRAFAAQLGTVNMVDSKAIARLVETDQTAVLERKLYPKMVRFTDPSDRTTVEEVDPDDLAKSFGAGTALRHITVQLGAAKQPGDVHSRLPWLKDRQGALIRRASDVSMYAMPLGARLTENDFVQD